MAHSNTSSAEPLVVSTRYGVLGHVELNRPAKINALNLDMLLELNRILKAWAEDPDIHLVLLTGRGSRGFCAGGDIADFHTAVTSGHHQDFVNLLAHEFDTDQLIANYPKPLVSLAHGITMGGGIGLASHAPVRLVTPEARMGMPEAKIGYTPDVGGSHLLANMPGHFGEYFAMTASSFNGADAVYLGFADATVSEEFADDILDHLDEFIGLNAADLAAAIEVMHGVPESHRLELDQGWVDHAFSADVPQEVIERLEQMVHPHAQQAAELISQNSPTSVASAFHAVRAARAENNLRGALDRELRLAEHLMYLPDLAEGIRAQVIDKDRNPQWNPATLANVDQQVLLGLMDPVDS
ncbi:enoyl-CoA hydratase/isomerase family protein [Glutamicibacter sp. NPDC087344]|uniref:enoyl-CoA hydratase/isomerase family protein n=1 Tax=Glutamicibacter sp. NPDC087344 TaxID=3363994 RepID=UPI003809BC51